MELVNLLAKTPVQIFAANHILVTEDLECFESTSVLPLITIGDE